MRNCLSLILLFLAFASAVADAPFPQRFNKILFLGDSITHGGHYISMVEAQLRLALPDASPTVINLGLPSETCSGLSEPEHPFPRPNVHERLERALEKIEPDLVVACYGMNDGIYYPLGEERFAAYRAGIDGIIKKVHAAGAELVLMTPPAFDALPLKKKGRLLPIGADEYSWKEIYEDYDAVMRRYADWIIQQADRVEMVIDLHSAVTDYVAEKRSSDPAFTMSPDGVHVDREGHGVLAGAIMDAWGIGPRMEPEQGLMSLISRRQSILHDAWLTEVGHKRPGMKPGLPIEEALAEAEEIEKQVRKRVPHQRDADARRADSIHSVHFPASKQPGELALFADYFLWMPPGVDQIRGIIVHQHGCGAGASSAGLSAASDWHWQALARKWDCALMGSSYESQVDKCRSWCDPRNGSERRFLQALDHFADDTGHAELSRVPWCLWGHSGGGFWASLMQVSHPERIAAIWLQSGTAFSYWEQGDVERPTLRDEVFQVPVMGCPGFREKGHERFHRAWDGLHAMMKAYRRHDAPFGIAADPRTGHECGDSRYLAIAFFDACLAQRLPLSGGSTQRLRPVDRSLSYLTSLENPEPQPAASFKGDPARAAWLPSESFATQWLEFIQVGSIGDSTPPPPPQRAIATRTPDGIVLTWAVHADFESGVAGFKVFRDDELAATLPTEPTGRFGRPIFQTMSYSDTPEQPVAQARWVDPEGSASRYQISCINSVGLESQPAAVTVAEP